MQATVSELASLVGGELIGDGSVLVHGAAPLAEAGPGDITLVDRAERAELLASTRASAVVAPRSLLPKGLPVIQVDDVHRAFTVILSRFRPPRNKRRIGISPLAVISPSARIGQDVDIHPFATIGDEVEIGDGATIYPGVHIMEGSKIGPEVTIFPNAVLYENTVVGPRCVIHAGAVLGAYGFGYFSTEGRHQLAAQLGNVVLEADVEVGAGATIDRGTYGATVIGEGTKIDNQVLIAHNCRIGRHNMLCGQVGIAGSTTTGDHVIMAGQVGVRDHVHIGSHAVLGAMAGVISDVPDRARLVGIPATPEREQMVKQAALAKLPEMRRQLKQLQATVNQLLRQHQAGQPDSPTPCAPNAASQPDCPMP
ncbi:MAG: UDP-3-O-(3-hydroxymyristoyl)glucosamine N-acyltransferase [Thermoguttaceae bacterium]